MPMTVYPDDISIWPPFNEMEMMILATAIALEICKREDFTLFGQIDTLGQSEFDYVPESVLDMSAVHPYSYNLFIAWRRLTLSFLRHEPWPFPGQALELPYSLPDEPQR